MGFLITLAIVCVFIKWLGLYATLLPTETNRCNLELRDRYDDL